MNSERTPQALKLVQHSMSKSSTFKSFFDTTGCFHVKKSGEIIGHNGALLELLGYPADISLSGRLFPEFCNSIQKLEWNALLDQLYKESAVRFDAIFNTYSGDFIQINCLGVYELGASIIDIYIYRDLNASEMLSTALTRLDTFEAFADTNLLDINIKDTQSRYLVTSALFEQTFSFPPGFAIGKTPEEIFPKAFADHVMAHDQQVLSSNRVVSQIDVVPTTQQHLLVQKFPVYRNGSIFGIGAFIVEVSALKHSEQRLMESRNRYQDFYALSTDTLIETDANWIIKRTNLDGTISITGLGFEIGTELLTVLKKNGSQPDTWQQLINQLDDGASKSEVFRLNNGKRIRVSIIQNSDVAEAVIYRVAISLISAR